MAFQNKCSLIFLGMIIAVFLAYTQVCIADTKWEPIEKGFSGSIIVGGYWLSGQRSQLDAEDDNRRLDSLNARGDNYSEGTPDVMINVAYGWVDSGTQISLGNTEDGEDGIKLGLSQKLGSVGVLQAGLLYYRKDVWQDPYLVGTQRSKTARDIVGFELGLESFMDTEVWFSVQYNEVDVDKDLIGDRISDLRRDGEIFCAQGGYVFDLAQEHIIIAGVAYERGEMDGKINQYNEFAAFMSYDFWMNDISIEIIGAATIREFDERNSMFGKDREETDYEANLTIKKAAPFGFQDFSIYTIIGYSTTVANIDFFDRHNFTAGLGIGYEF